MLRIEHLSKFYGDFTAVDDISIQLDKGKFLTILGPSGSGKTTTLMSVAGFVLPDKGTILVDGKDITQVKPHKRNIGMVFQNYALFPHMTILQNVMYPLKMRHIPKAESQKTAEKYLSIVGLSGLESRYPKELSGGQQQRVALARALVFNPPLLLMDEPLGALDKQLRQRMQLEIKHIQKQLNITVVYVTHDQEEALTMSDEIIIMNHGAIEQQGTPWELYEQPANRFVAEFMGESNLIPAKITAVPEGTTFGKAEIDGGYTVSIQTGQPLKLGDEVILSIRPEYVTVTGAEEDEAIPAKLEETIYLGEATRYRMKLEGSNQEIIAKQTKVRFSTLQETEKNKTNYINWPSSATVVLIK